MSMPDGSLLHIAPSQENVRMYLGRLKYVLAIYRKRREWLTSLSRRIFGRVLGKTAVIILHFPKANPTTMAAYSVVLKLFVQEQLTQLEAVNMILTGELQSFMWRADVEPVTETAIQSLLGWVERLPMLSACGTADSSDALFTAFSMHTHGLHFVTDGSCVKTPQLLFKRAAESKLKVSAASINLDDTESLQFLEQLTSLTGGTLHQFTGDVRDGSDGCSVASTCADSDLELLEAEITAASKLVALLESLQLASSAAPVSPSVHGPRLSQGAVGRAERRDNVFEWLKTHGIAAKKLTFYDAVLPCVYPHVRGEVPSPFCLFSFLA